MSLEGNGASASNGHAVDHASNGNGNGEHAKSCTDASHHSNGHRNTIEWVACDRCNKWRSIPKDVHATLKPEDNWYCEMNTGKFNTCDAEQELPDDAIDKMMSANGDGGLDTLSPYDIPLPGQPYKWAKVKKNIFYHRKARQIKADEVLVCDCEPPRDGSMGCGEDCCNRMLAVQCTPGYCPCGDQCGNMGFFKRDYSQIYEARSGKKGYGLFAGEDMKAGAFIIEYVGEVLEDHTYSERKSIYQSQTKRHYYFMSLGGSEVIDASLRGNLGRFINHSCDPNCETQKWQVGGEICIGLFTLVDIVKGTELTFDYNFERYGEKPMKCLCEEKNCRQWIGGAPGIAPEEWEEEDWGDEPEPVMIEEEGAPPEGYPSDDDEAVLLGSDDEGGDDEDAKKRRERARKAAAAKRGGAKRRGGDPNARAGQKGATATGAGKGGGKKAGGAGGGADGSGKEGSDFLDKKRRKAKTIAEMEAEGGLSDGEGEEPAAGAAGGKPKTALPKAGKKVGPLGGGVLGVAARRAPGRAREFKLPKKFVRRSEVDRRLDEVRNEETGAVKSMKKVVHMLRLIKLATAELKGTIHAGSARDFSLVLDVVEKTKSLPIKKEMIRLNILGMLGLVVKDMYTEKLMLPVLRKIMIVLGGLPVTEERLKAAKTGAGQNFADQLRQLSKHPDTEVRTKAGEHMVKFLNETPEPLMPAPPPRPAGRSSLDGPGGRRDSMGSMGSPGFGMMTPRRDSFGGHGPFGTPGTPSHPGMMTPSRAGMGTPGGMMTPNRGGMTPLHPGMMTPSRGGHMGVPGTPMYQPVPHTPQYQGVPGTPGPGGMMTPRRQQLPPPPGPGGMGTPGPNPMMTPMRGGMMTPAHLMTPTADRMGAVHWGVNVPSFQASLSAAGLVPPSPADSMANGDHGVKRGREWEEGEFGEPAKRAAGANGAVPQLAPPAGPPPRGAGGGAAGGVGGAPAAKKDAPLVTFDAVDEMFEGVVYDVVKRRIGKYKQDEHPLKTFITDKVAEDMLKKYGSVIVEKEKEKYHVRQSQGKASAITKEQIEESIKAFVKSRVNHYVTQVRSLGSAAVKV